MTEADKLRVPPSRLARPAMMANPTAGNVVERARIVTAPWRNSGDKQFEGLVFAVADELKAERARLRAQIREREEAVARAIADAEGTDTWDRFIEDREDFRKAARAALAAALDEGK